MGNAAPTATDGDDFAEFDGIETLGYRVLGVQPNSPAAEAGLVSFFDFLVGANEQMLLGSGQDLEEGEEYDDIDFPALLHESKGKIVELLVWNIKAQEKRLVELIPNDDWEGAGLLGVTIKLDNYGGADERLIRVLEVVEDSPAYVAGLVPMKDYLLGTTFTGFASSQILATVLEEHVDHVVEIYVYNSDSDVVRVVALMPTFSWGGRGLLGAEVGTGYLHRLPNSCRSTIGQSVERKVRWTNKQKNDAPAEDETGGDSSLLEMEPHLEMEVERDDKNRHLNPEDVARQPHELGSNEGRAEKAAKVVEPQTSAQSTASHGETTSEQRSIPATAAAEPSASMTAPPAAESTAEPQQVATSELPPPPILETATSAEDAAALFSGPPPTATEPLQQSEQSQGTTSYNSQNSFIPPPPKMHY